MLCHAPQVALVDPTLCTSLSKEQTAAMAFTALAACFDALLARELASGPLVHVLNGSDVLLKLAKRGIGAVAEGLPVALQDGKNNIARELLAIGSVCAGQLSVMTPAPPTQVGSGRRSAMLRYYNYASHVFTVGPCALFHQNKNLPERREESRRDET